ncbi:MAG: GNAT family N-acetyltransferase [Geodermatophilaceae bacterium]|nr:GNAT family N-acetyltransferase [Geodermatophilaceae bacterium]
MAGFVLPTVTLRDSFLAAMAEFAAEGRGAPDDHSGLGDDLRTWAEPWSTPAGFAVFVQELLDEQVRPRRPGWVTATMLWWVEGAEFLGRLQIRHSLTNFLREAGGHVGYDVRPSARRRGHATAMLAAALPRAAVLGIPSALITCDVDNIASRRVIEGNGGVLEDEREGKLRFWVPTGTSARP